MKQFVATLSFCLFLMSAGAACDDASSHCSDETLNRVKAATVFISARRTLTNTGQVESREGTGFVISSRGFVLTTAHTVEKGDGVDQVTIKGAIASRYAQGASMHVIERNDHDVALLQFDDTSKPYPNVTLGNPGSVSASVTLCSVGFTAGREYFFVTGALGERGGGGEGGFWATQMPSNPGDSGAPVFISSGGVVGIKRGAYEGLQNVNQIIPLNLAQNLINEAVLPPDDKRERISLLMKRMCDRGLLQNPYEWELRGDVYVSLQNMKLELTKVIEELPADSPGTFPLLKMQTAIREMVEDPKMFPQQSKTANGPISDDMIKEIAKFRTEYSTDLRDLEEIYSLPHYCDIIRR